MLNKKKNKINPIRKLRLLIKQKLGWLGTPVIIPYAGYGDTEEAFFIGCVSEDKGLSKPQPDNSVWQNLVAMIRRFTSEEIPGIRVKGTFLGMEEISITDRVGIFRLSFKLKDKNIDLPEDFWNDIKLELPDNKEEQGKPEVTGRILLLKPGDSSYGVISDIDDTILVSHSFNIIKKFRLMLFNNAYTRLPFEGVAAFYRALNKGAEGKYNNPIFYVSNSQWNLYDLLTDFCEIRNIPQGIMLLREFKPFRPKRFIRKKSAIAKRAHKLDKIRSIMTTYEYLKFVLIGDSGQKDAEIYEQIVKEFPGRILAVYIRDIRKSRIKKILFIENTLKHEGVEMLLIKDTVKAAKDAIEKRLISAESLNDVVNEKTRDHMAEIQI